jgi:deoxyribonuclease-4
VKPLQDKDVENFRKKLDDSKIDRDSVFVHMPYLPNLSSPNSRLHKKSTSILVEELRRSSLFGIPYVIIHLGSHGGKGSENGTNQLIKACNFAFEKYYKSSSTSTTAAKNKKKNESSKKGGSVTILLENSAGEKNSIGSKFGELGLILDKLMSSPPPNSSNGSS